MYLKKKCSQGMAHEKRPLCVKGPLIHNGTTFGHGTIAHYQTCFPLWRHGFLKLEYHPISTIFSNKPPFLGFLILRPAICMIGSKIMRISSACIIMVHDKRSAVDQTGKSRPNPQLPLWWLIHWIGWSIVHLWILHDYDGKYVLFN